MRIDRLGLVRYGHFTDAWLDLPRPAAPDGADLHIVYGPNEAGKSTLLSAWLDLLYGIHAQSSYAFVHDYAAMRIEAVLSPPEGAPVQLARIKGRGNTLRDGRDQPLPDAALGPLMAGLDRGDYTTMFSLDDDTLEAGGDSILASRGDLGRLLFQASAGLAELGAELDRLRDGLGAYFQPGVRRTQLADHKKALAALADERHDHDVQISAWQKRQQDRDAARTDYVRAAEALEETRTEIEALTRQRSAFAPLDRLRRDRAALAELPPVDDTIPDDWPARLDALRDEAAQLAALRPQATEALAALRAQAAALVPDADAAACTDRVERLDQRLGVWLQQQADLPNRQLELRALQGRIDDIRHALGAPDTDPAALVLPTQVQGALGGLMQRHAGLERTAANAVAEARDARTALEDAQAAAADGPPAAPPGAVAVLAALLPDLRAADPAGAEARAAAALHDARGARDAALAALAPWQGDADALAALVPPGAQALRGWEAALSRLDADRRAAQADTVRLRAELAVRAAELSASDAEDLSARAKTSRAQRDAAWRAHRATLDPRSAADFEAALRTDDALTDVRLARADAQARAAQLRAQQARDEAALAQAAQQLRQIEDEITQTQTAITEAAAPIWPGRDASVPPATLLQWLERRDLALARAQDSAAADTAHTEARVRRDAAQTRLARALDDADQPAAHDLAADLARAQALIDGAARAEARASALQASTRALARREATLREAEAGLEAWAEDWRTLCRAHWMGGDPAPDPATMEAILARLRDLAPLLTESRGLHDRIAKLGRDHAGFVADLRALAAQLGEDPGDADPPALWHRLRARIRHAAETDRTLAELAQHEQAALEEIAALSARTTRLEEALAPMRARLGVDGLDDLAARLAAQMRARDLAQRVAEAMRDVSDALAAPADMAAAIATLDALDRDALGARIETLSATSRAQDAAVAESYARLAQAQAALDAVGGDDAAARLEERRRTLILQIEDEARDWLRLSLGVRAVEAALLHHRDEHRSTMLAEAATAFRTLTNGAYAGLTTRPERDGEVLIAQTAAGAGVAVQRLSKGTRFQLYLALRIAGYHEFARARAPVPFLADDIMETFDDARAEAAFGLLAGMARRGQVIYLTHHAHLCAIARRACPDVAVHDLSTLAPLRAAFTPRG